MRQVMGTTQSIRHTRSLRPKMNDLIATFNKLESGWANLQDVIHHMESREVDLAEFLLAVGFIAESKLHDVVRFLLMGAGCQGYPR